MVFVALCAVGAEKVVANELRKLGSSRGADSIGALESGFGRVRFETDLRGAYRALISLRAADRILLEAARLDVGDFDTLFEAIRSVAWEDFIPRGTGLHIAKVRSNRSRLQSETSVQAVVHKAAAERLCGKYGLSRLPEDGALAEIRVYIEKDQASVLLDLCGEPLFKRGYRSEGGIAPLRETTAAALILLSGWRRKFPLYDPFCGSGTIAIEAALYAWDAAPGLGRSFALSGLAFADAEIEKTIREEYLAKVDFTRTIRIYGSDADVRPVSMARANVQRAYELAQGKQPIPGARQPVPQPFLPAFKTLALKDAVAPTGDAGFIITNPPYGKRLGERSDAEALYHAMNGLIQRFPRWKLGVVTDHPGFESLFGKKASSCREITNGAVASYFFQYETL
jgi:putative N6-adenine-specific DNA methylase